MNNKYSTLWILIALLAIAILLSGGSGGMMGFGMGFGAIMMLLFWGAIIWLVLSLVNTSHKKSEETPALTILKKRYAKGEITRGQYLEMEKEMKE